MTSATPARRVVLYARVSQARDQRSKSVDDQLRELREWANREGWEIVAEYRDDGVSASSYARRQKSRPGWQRAQEAITSGQVDALLVWEISRASRDRAVFAGLFAACIDAGVLLGSGGRLADLTDPDEAFSADLGAAQAVRESAMISKRTQRAVDSRAAAGRPNGALTYGYRRVIDPNTGRVTGRELHPEQAPVVAEIVRRLLAGHSAGTIAADLNERGVQPPTGERWVGQQLRAFLRRMPDHPVAVEVRQRLDAGEQAAAITADLNVREVPQPDQLRTRWRSGNLSKLALRPTYAGLRVHRGQVLDGVRATWPPIISEEDHHALVELYASPERDKFRTSTNVRYLGSGIYRCGRQDCTGRMKVVAPYASRPRSYQCRQCLRVARQQELVDHMVERALLTFLSREDVLAQLTAPDDSVAQLAAQEAERLRGKIMQARQLLHDDRLSVESFADLEQRTLPLLRDAERRARPPALPSPVLAVAGPEAAARWAATELAEQRTILDALLVVTIMPVGSARPFDPTSVEIRRRQPSHPVE